MKAENEKVELKGSENKRETKSCANGGQERKARRCRGRFHRKVTSGSAKQSTKGQ